MRRHSRCASYTFVLSASLFWTACTAERAPTAAEWPVASAPADAAGGPSATEPEPEPEPGPRLDNVIVVLLDDVGDDKLTVMGFNPDAPPTPTIDGLAADGVAFRQAYASPVCSPTRAALLTGRYGRRTGVGVIFSMHASDYTLPLSERTLAELVAEGQVPYASAACGKWHLTADVNPNALTDPLDQGFGWWAGTLSNLDASFAPRHRRTLDYYHWERIFDGTASWVDGTYVTTSTIDDAIGRLAVMPEPWLLYLPLNAAHPPMQAAPPPELYPPPAIGDGDPPWMWMNATLEAADHELGRMLDAIPPGVRARTTIFVIGDNGTSDAGTEPAFEGLGGKGTLHETGIRVPLIVSGPAVSAAARGAVSDALVSVVDVFPTIAELAGAPPEVDGRAIDGVSLLPLLADPDLPGRPFVYTERFEANGPPPYRTDMRVVRDDRFKLVWDANHGDTQLYGVWAGALDDGKDLLPGPLDGSAATHLAALTAELGRLDATLRFEGADR